MSKTPQEYYNEVIGRRFDEDGVYDCQCVDAFKHWLRTQVGLNLGKKSICYPTNHATSIWDNFEELGLNKYFDKVPSNQMVDGDWAIWSMNSRSCPYSHIAMFRKDNGNGTGVFLGQNQCSHPEYTQVNIYYDGLRGGLRPKIYHETPTPTPVPKENPIYITLGDMYVRCGAGTNYGVKRVRDLTEDGKKHATSTNPDAYAVYKKGTRFTCYELVDLGRGVWARTPSGYVCVIGKSGTVYCEEVKD